MSFDAVWDAWTAAGHAGCGGWRYDPDPDGGTATCACGTVIPHPAAAEAVSTSVDRAGREATSAPQARGARTTDTPRVREHRPALPSPPAGPATSTSPPAAPATPRRSLPEGTQTPGGGAPRAVETSAPLTGQAWRNAAQAAQTAHNAARLRARFTRAAKRTGPGMIRKPPPGNAA